MPQDWDLSEALVAYMDRIVDRYQIDVDTFSHNLTEITVMFEDGSVQTYHMDATEDADDLTFMVTSIYESGELLYGSYVTFQDMQGIETMINMENVSMMKLPLTAVEEAITKCRLRLWQISERITKLDFFLVV